MLKHQILTESTQFLRKVLYITMEFNEPLSENLYYWRQI